MERKKPSFVCKTCGEKFAGGRNLGDHYRAHPDHDTRPKAKKTKKAAAPKAAPKPTQPKLADLSATDLIKLTLQKLTDEINAKRQLLQDIEKIRTEVTQLENQRESLKKMVQ